MKYESIKVITGTPKEVQKKLNEWAEDAHPHAAIISTALAVSPAGTAAAKSKKPGEESSDADNKPVITMTATVGIAYP